MKQIYTEILIRASAADIWRVLTDFAHYPAWNPYHVLAEGEIEEGKAFRAVVQFQGAWKTRHRLTTLRLIPRKEWIYKAVWFLPGVMDGEFIVQLEEEAPGRTRFIQKQNIGGGLVPFIWSWLTEHQITTGLEMMNRALKKAVEAPDSLQREMSVVTRFGNRDQAALERLRGEWALVTGASSGIGREYAVQLAAAGVNVVLVARRRALLEDLAVELRRKNNVRVKVLAQDLAKSGAGESLRRTLHSDGIRVRLLCNVAGADAWGHFEDAPLSAYRAMVEVQIWRTIELCYLFREDLESHLTSAVINISSQSAVQPVPYFSVYAAVKAFVLEFSQSLYGEWLRRGILVQTVLVGPTETEIVTAVRLKNYGVIKKLMAPTQVVVASLRHLALRLPIATPGPRPILLWLLSRFFPARTVIFAMAHHMRPRRQADQTC